MSKPEGSSPSKSVVVLDNEKCNSLYRVLIRLQPKVEQDMLSSAYIRCFFETVGCDHISNFSDQREDYRAKLGDDLLGRILNFEDTPSDEMRASQAVMLCTDLHERRLISSLNWTSWIQHYTVNKVEKTLASLMIISTGYAGMHYVFNTFRKFKENRLKK
eukprot:CAMPEP_0172151474 /NCGR_PEP_ID=MMETSP1050-20130122/249_1 /TAXON_ID=233186 /ORGANISM="Cryptomonas curvata, Strain CCAP979/52" /LENGTH=159 /DNA_ID=CAMNT_0012819583 /DNA_START=55 /DNA_END=534 /DNA_ORIENTATION=+